MIELSRHIESLMLNHDCVIVPGLGGFITQYMHARYIAEEGLFLPPYRSVGFNQQLTFNDGLLVQSYMQAYDTSYPETVRLIDNAVKQLRNTITEEGKYELHGIGTLTQGVNGAYDFAPCEAGVLSPELYGLDSLPLATRTEGLQQTADDDDLQPAKQHSKKPVKRLQKDYTIRISREIVNYAAAGVVAIAFYLLWATPMLTTTQTERQTASVLGQCLFAQPQAVAVNHTPVATAVPTASHTASAPASQKAEATKPATPCYTIVLASAITRKNADSFVEALQAKGYDQTFVHQKGRMTRVLYGHYDTEEAARQAARKLRDQADFDDAWVMHLL